MHESEKSKWSRSVESDPQRPHGLQPSRLLCPRDFPGKSTGVGCHCLLRAPTLYYSQTPPPPSKIIHIYVVCVHYSYMINIFMSIKILSVRAQSCPILCNPMDYGPWGASVHGISQARTLEWVAISLSREYSWPRDWNCISCTSYIGRCILYQLHHLGSLQHHY